MNGNDRKLLENLIEVHGLPALVSELSSICSERSLRYAVNQQDMKMAKLWMSRSVNLDNVCAKLESK